MASLSEPLDDDHRDQGAAAGNRLAQLRTPTRTYFQRHTTFEEMRLAKAFFSDSTDCINTLLNYRHVHFERPCQFGKTTFMSILGAFLDVATTEQDFEDLFDGTLASSIQHELRQSCYVLSVSLGIQGRQPTEVIRNRVSAAINNAAYNFHDTYADLNPYVDIMFDVADDDGFKTLENLSTASRRASLR